MQPPRFGRGGGGFGGSRSGSTDTGDSGGGGGGDDDDDEDSGGRDSSGGPSAGAGGSPGAGGSDGSGGGVSGGSDDDPGGASSGGGRNPSGGPSAGAGGDPADDDPSRGTDEPSGRTPGGGPSAGAGGAPEDDNPAIGGDPTDDDPSRGEPGFDGSDDDNGSRNNQQNQQQQQQRQNQIDEAIDDAIQNSPFVDAASGVTAEFQDGSVQTSLTGAAAQAQREAQNLIDTNPAADAIADLSIGDDISVRQDVQRSFERQQTISQTVSESRFADDPSDVSVEFNDGQADAQLTGDAAAAQQAVSQTVNQSPFADDPTDVVVGSDPSDTQLTGDAADARAETADLLQNDPAADSLSDIAIDDGNASVTGEAEREFRRTQNRRLRDTVFNSPTDESIIPGSGADTEPERVADPTDVDTEQETDSGGDSSNQEETETVDAERLEDELFEAGTNREADGAVSGAEAAEVVEQFSQDDTAELTNIEDAPALAAQIERQTGVDAREVDSDQGTVESVTLDDDGFSAVVEREQQNPQQRQQQAQEQEQETAPSRDSLEAQLGLQTDRAAARANRRVAGVRRQRQDVRQARAENRAAVNRFGQQQLAVGQRRDENPLAADVVENTEESLRADRPAAPFGDSALGQIAGAQTRVGTIPTRDIISGIESAERDEDLVDSATSGGLFAETDARSGSLEAVLDPNDAPDGSVITGVTGVSEQDLARDTGISEDLAEFIEEEGETPVTEGGRPDAEERFPEQVVEGTATAASAFINPEFFGRQVERTAEIADPETAGQIIDDPANAGATAASVLGETAVQAGEQFSRDPGTPVGGAVFTGLTAGAASAAAGRRVASGRTLRDAVTAELDPRIGPFGETIESSTLNRLTDGGRVIEQPDGGRGSGSGSGGSGSGTSGVDPGGDDTFTLTSDDIDIGDGSLINEPDTAARDRAEQELRRRQEASQTPADRQQDADPGSFRDDVRTVERRETTTVDDSVDTSRSGPTAAEQQAARSRRTGTFDDDLGLSPRERQLAAQEERPDRDFRVRPQVRFDDELSLRSGEARTPTVGQQLFGTVAGVSTIAEAEERREQAQAVLPGLRDATDPTTGAETVTDVFGDSGSDTVADDILGTDSDTGTAIDPLGGIDTGIDTRIDVGSDSRLGADADTRVRTDARQDIDTRQDTRQDTGIRQDPDFQDQDFRDPDPTDPDQDIRDPDFTDPDRRDFDPGTPFDDDDDDDEDALFGGSAADDVFGSGIADAQEVLGTDGSASESAGSLEDQLGL